MRTFKLRKKQFIVLIIILLVFEVSSRILLKYLYYKYPMQYAKYALCSEIFEDKYTFTAHPYICYYPRPNWSYGKLSHNSLGYRGKEFSKKKPDGVFRIVVLGGSSTYDNPIMDNEKTTTEVMEHILKNKYGHGNVEVINAGAGGYSSWESLANLEFRIIDISPDLVIIYHGTNDVHPRLVPQEKYVSDNIGFRKAWSEPEIYFWEKSCFLRIVTRAFGYAIDNDNLKRRIGLESYVCTPYVKNAWQSNPDPELLELLKKNPPIYFERNLRNMVAIAKEHNIKVMLVTWASTPFFEAGYAQTAHYLQGFKENNEVVRNVAKLHKIPLFDFASIMPQDREYWADGSHVNEKGAEKKAALFVEFINNEGILR